MPAVRQSALIHRTMLIGILAAAAGAVALQAWWTRPSGSPLSITQIHGLLPRGSLLHSMTRLEMDGRPPQEVAAVGVIPRYPGSNESVYFAFVFGYDRWQRRARALYAQPTSSPVPRPVDAVRLSGSREAALFGALHDDGTLSYHVLGMARGVRVLHEGRVGVGSRLLIAEALLIEDGEQRRALGWNGRRFSERPLPAAFPHASPGLSWRYRVHKGMVFAQIPVVRLRPRQTLRVSRIGGGLIPIILPDQRLDVIGADVYRARSAGTYTIDILVPFTAPEQTYRLTLIVE
jgi:hypothetical protein